MNGEAVMTDSARTMTTSEVRDLLNLGSAAAARVQLNRWRKAGLIEATGRTLSGEKTWPAAAVREAKAHRPGRGSRTDLRRRDHGKVSL